ncbi:MAG: ribosome silencing factor [Chloroflexota bacterium]
MTKPTRKTATAEIAAPSADTGGSDVPPVVADASDGALAEPSADLVAAPPAGGVAAPPADLVGEGLAESTTLAQSPKPDGMPRRARAMAKARKAAADADRSPLEIARRIVDLAEDKKAADIVLLDLQGLTTLADYFVICSGGSDRQLGAIADGIIGGMRDEKIRPFGREGTPASHWVLVDFGIVIVHIFTPPERDFYQLEKHWAEAKTVLRVQ